MSPALEDSCLDQSDADHYYLSVEKRAMQLGIRKVIEHLKDETYHSFEDIIADLEAVVAG